MEMFAVLSFHIFLLLMLSISTSICSRNKCIHCPHCNSHIKQKKRMSRSRNSKYIPTNRKRQKNKQSKMSSTGTDRKGKRTVTKETSTTTIIVTDIPQNSERSLESHTASISEPVFPEDNHDAGQVLQMRKTTSTSNACTPADSLKKHGSDS